MSAQRSPFIGSTSIPNDVLDTWLRTLSGPELKVMLYVVRQTDGFRLQDRRFSTSEVARGTGLKKDAVKLAMRSLLICTGHGGAAALSAPARVRHARRPAGEIAEPGAGGGSGPAAAAGE